MDNENRFDNLWNDASLWFSRLNWVILFKSILRRFKWVLLSYIAFILIWFVARSYVLESSEIEKKLMLGSGFYVSWLASLSEDIIFFGVIGLLGLIISTKLPEDENIDIRVNSLANGRHSGRGAKKYLATEIKKLLVYNDKSSVKLVINKVDIENNVVEIYTEIIHVIANMCKDVEYPYVTTAYVSPGKVINGDYGYISYLGIYDTINPNNKAIFVEGEIRKLTVQEFKQETNFKISADGSAIWKMCYSLWCPINEDRSNEDNWYFLQTFAYSESLGVKIINKTNQDNILIDYSYTDRGVTNDEVIKENIFIKSLDSTSGSNEVTILPLQSHINDKIKIYLHLQTS